jgi:hypothetical protein
MLAAKDLSSDMKAVGFSEQNPHLQPFTNGPCRKKAKYQTT